MKTLGRISTLRAACQRAAHPLVLVPTMGALHEAHAALIRRARKIAGIRGTVAVSIFVNPIQFDSPEDLAAYPRSQATDQRLCKKWGVDILFCPSVGEMFHKDQSVFIEEEVLSRVLCGAKRMGHFRGVCTIVAKLFHLFAPHAAIFGGKDYQQLMIIRRMVRDLNFAVRIVEHSTLREKDGLAMSSRNVRLGDAARKVAPGIYQALLRAKAHAQKNPPSQVVARLKQDLASLPGARIDYVECVDADSLAVATDWLRPAVIGVAVFLEQVRLIDNIQICPIAKVI